MWYWDMVVEETRRAPGLKLIEAGSHVCRQQKNFIWTEQYKLTTTVDQENFGVKKIIKPTMLQMMKGTLFKPTKYA